MCKELNNLYNEGINRKGMQLVKETCFSSKVVAKIIAFCVQDDKTSL